MPFTWFVKEARERDIKKWEWEKKKKWKKQWKVLQSRPVFKAVINRDKMWCECMCAPVCLGTKAVMKPIEATYYPRLTRSLFILLSVDTRLLSLTLIHRKANRTEGSPWNHRAGAAVLLYSVRERQWLDYSFIFYLQCSSKILGTLLKKVYWLPYPL